MKKMKSQSTEPCAYCKQQNRGFIRANWKSNGLSVVMFACQDHVNQLRDHEIKNRDDGHMTEADYQTWGSLT